MSQLSKACGMSLGNITFYYRKKEDLVLASLDNLLYQVLKILKETMPLPDDYLLKHLFQSLLCVYVANQDETRYKHMAETSGILPLLDKLNEKTYLVLVKACKQIKLPIDELDIITGTISAVSSYYMMIRRFYNQDLPINYYRVFRMYCDILFSQITFPELKGYHDMTLEYFEALDKTLFMERYREIIAIQEIQFAK